MVSNFLSGEPAANCYRTGNHLGVQPHGFKDSIEFAVDDLNEIGPDYTLSAFVSEGGNFGLFTPHERIKRLNTKMYAEANSP